MSTDTQATVIDQADADAFKEFAEAFDNQNGVAKTEVELVQPETERASKSSTGKSKATFK